MSHPSNPHSDRNLLFGVLALQMNFMSRDDLVTGMHRWVQEKSKSLGQILLEEKRLLPEQVEALDALIVQHLKAHGDAVERSLRAVNVASTAVSDLTPFSDRDVQASISHLNPELERDTVAYQASSTGARYQKLRPHASGGLGEVFVAEDTELHREVALKEIKPKYADDKSSRQRFVVEAEITGGLAHPGIVPVYGLGAYTDGRPYYAMRFIRGESMKQAIDQFHANDKARKPGNARDASERSLAFRQLLRRFVDVCNAVAYAHDRKVLHRDLKPANIMLGKFGETLVVDWGLAKAGIASDAGAPSLATEPALNPASGSDMHATQAGAAIGTIPFMSPEQASGRIDLLGPASDIYSLGSTLYVLLTGQRPYRGKDDAETLTMVQKGICAPPREVKPDTPPPLDAICRKAMALEMKDRYETALELAADIEHWLADEPVAAYPEPWTARAARWARRHRAAVVGAIVFLASAVAALAVSTIVVSAEQAKTASQKEIALGNYTLARALSFSSIDLLESTQVDLASNPLFQAKRRGILSTGADACRRFLKEESDDPVLRTHAAQVYRYAANFHRLENELKLAEPLYRDSLILQAKLVEEFPDELPRLDKLTATLRDEASLLTKTGRIRHAVENYARALEIAQKLQAANQDQAPYRRLRATLMLDLASVEYALGNNKQSKQNAKSSADLLRDLLDLPPGKAHPYDSLLLAAALTRIAIVERDENLKEAVSTHKEAVKILAEIEKKRPPQIVLADILHHQSNARLEQARTNGAAGEKNLDAAARQWIILAKNYPKVPLYRSSQAQALAFLGNLRADDGRVKEARVDFERAQKLLEELVKTFPDTPSYRAELGRAYLGLGRIARQEKDEKSAARWLAAAVEALSAASAQSPDSVTIRRALGEARAALAS